MFIVLIVEDHPEYRKAVIAILEAAFPGLVFHEAASGREAKIKVIQHHPHLIIMDIGLGDASGLVLTGEIKTLYPQTVIAVLSNHDSQEYREAAGQFGADYFLSKRSIKPSDIKELIQSVCQLQAASGRPGDCRPTESGSPVFLRP
ncbi:MAG: response regulator transcription factor [Thermodesulfobacteriota bacterium]